MAYCLGYHEKADDGDRLVKQLSSSSGQLSEQLVTASASEISKVKSMIQKTMPGLIIREVKKVKNSFLEGMYNLKKEEYVARFGKVSEMQLFHATSAANVHPIVKDNFDWRRVSRGKFGRGTSFSDSAQYANKYANTLTGNKRAFIIAKVLVTKTTVGHYSMKVPPRKYDTTVGNNKVYVKFNDNEALPQYIAYYNNKDTKRFSHVEDEDDLYGDSYDFMFEPYGYDYQHDYDRDDFDDFYHPFDDELDYLGYFY